MFSCELSMVIDQNDYTMNLTNNTGIPLEYVEFELKHAKVNQYFKNITKFLSFLRLPLLLLLSLIGIYGEIKVQLVGID